MTEARMNGVGRNRSEEKSDNGYEKHSGEREEQVAFHDPEIEKQQDGRQGQERADSNDFHRQVLLCPGNGRVALPLAFHFLCSQTHSPHDDFAAFENADDTGHGDTADTDALGILEDLFGTGLGGCNGRTSGTHDEVGEQP